MTRRLPTTPTPPHWRSSAGRWQQACAGELPAEALPPQDRRDLVERLHALGWSDRQISEHTKLSDYTVARIRREQGICTRTKGDGETL